MIAVSPREQFEYIFEEDRDSEAPTKFVLRPLPKRATLECEDLIGMRATEEGIPSGTFHYTCLKHGWVGVENLRYTNGEEVLWQVDSNGCVADEIVFLLSSRQRAELANAIWDRSSLSAIEAKNSELQSTSQKDN